MRNFLETTSVMTRAAGDHLRYFSPVAKEMSPPQYAGKVESTCATMAFDLMGIKLGEQANPREIARFAAGWNLLFRANDEVVDGVMPYTDQPVTVDDLNNTPIFHKYAGPEGREVTGAEGLGIMLESAGQLIPGDTPGAIRRRTAIEDLAIGYTNTIAEASNNPAYHDHDMLPFTLAMGSKRDVTGQLGETTIGLFSALLDIPDTAESRDLYGKIGMAMQFGDDTFDWRKDRKEYQERRLVANGRPLRPQENLFNSLLLEEPVELEACEAVLDEPGKRSVTHARERAPRTYDRLQAELLDTICQFPKHPYTDRASRIVMFMMRRVVPAMPETGKFASWAKC